MKTIIINGLVYDGTGAKPINADIVIEDSIISDIQTSHNSYLINKQLQDANTQIIDAQGYIVCPGFVDIHRHCDVTPLIDTNFGDIELAQGITSTVVGNCGLSPIPSVKETRKDMYDFIEPVVGSLSQDIYFESYKDYVTAMKKIHLPLNMGFFAASGAIKTLVKGFVSTPYTSSEIQQAKHYINQAMEAGALGVSLGIMYQPEFFSSPEEIASIISPVAQYDGLLTTHIRGEGDSLVESIKEVIKIATMAGLRLHISHFKATGIKNWHSTIFRAIECIEEARSKGISVTADFYPYDGGSTTMLSLVPPSLLAGGNQALFDSLHTQQGKSHFKTEIYKDHSGWDNMVKSIGWDRILISSVTKIQHASYSGKAISLVAQELGYNEPADFVADILVEEQGKVGIIVLSMSQDDIDTIARLPWTMLISDSLYGGGQNPHPRLYGSFPKFLREYVLERKVLTREEAIYKMTWMPTQRAGIKNRGKIEKGFYADIAIFNPMQFKDTATYTHSKVLSQGMERVLVNGKTVWHQGKQIKETSGCFLER